MRRRAKCVGSPPRKQNASMRPRRDFLVVAEIEGVALRFSSEIALTPGLSAARWTTDFSVDRELEGLGGLPGSLGAIDQRLAVLVLSVCRQQQVGVDRPASVLRRAGRARLPARPVDGCPVRDRCGVATTSIRTPGPARPPFISRAARRRRSSVSAAASCRPRCVTAFRSRLLPATRAFFPPLSLSWSTAGSS